MYRAIHHEILNRAGASALPAITLYLLPDFLFFSLILIHRLAF